MYQVYLQKLAGVTDLTCLLPACKKCPSYKPLCSSCLFQTLFVLCLIHGQRDCFIFTLKGQKTEKALCSKLIMDEEKI